jgi:hypothetical protein
MNTTMTAELISQRWAEFSDAGRQYFDAPRASLWRHVERTRDALNVAHETARDDWARARGWTYSPRFWRYDYPEIDHCEGFVNTARQRVGFVTHSYASREELKAYAAAHGLNVAVLPWSWYAPTKALAAVFTPKEGAP